MQRWSRRTLVSFWILLILTALLAVPNAAVAKSFMFEGLSVSGLGASEPIEIDGEQLSRWSRNDSSWWSNVVGTTQRSAEPKSLGPEYRLAIDFQLILRNNKVGSVEQRFYPFASEGAVVFTPRGQTLAMTPGRVLDVPTGWFQVSSVFVDRLQRNGLPDLESIFDASVTVPTTRGTSAQGAAWVTLIAAAAGALYAANRRRDRFAALAPGSSGRSFRRV